MCVVSDTVIMYVHLLHVLMLAFYKYTRPTPCSHLVCLFSHQTFHHLVPFHWNAFWKKKKDVGRKGLWEAALREARRETDNNVKRKRNRAKRDTSSIQTRVVYTEHCARKGALSKANQDITSTSMTNVDPTNIDLLRVKHPEPAHPSRDLMRLSSIL